MRYGATHKDETRQKLLKVAADAIRAHGPQQIAVARVMEGAGLTHGGFYAHFRSKDELVTAAIATMFEESEAHFLHQVSGRSPAQGLWHYIRFYLSRAHRDAIPVGCPVAALVSEMTRVSPEARAAFAEGTTRLRKRLAGLLSELGDAEANPNAESLLCEMVGALMLARGEPDQTRSDKILMRAKTALKQRFHLESCK